MQSNQSNTGNTANGLVLRGVGILLVVSLILVFSSANLRNEEPTKPKFNTRLESILPRRVEPDQTASCGPDIAFNRPAVQSSSWGGIPASRAVDHNQALHFQQCSHTNSQARSFWYVDLGSTKTICSVSMTAIDTHYASRLRNFVVFVTDTPPAVSMSPPLVPSTSICTTELGVFLPSQTRTYSCHTTMTGRYVGVQFRGGGYLQLCNVQVREVIVAPVIHFDFTSPTNPLTDKVAGIVMALHNGAQVNPLKKAVEMRTGQFGIAGNVIQPGETLTDKTISVWARLTGLTGKGGAAVSIEEDQRFESGFDAIVWGEYNARNQWQPGSDWGHRWAAPNTNTAPPETVPNVLRLLTLVNDRQNNRLKFYVDGAKVLDYAVTTPFPSYGSATHILLNYRHSHPTTTCDMDIYDVKIFDKVLVDSEIQQLFTNKPAIV